MNAAVPPDQTREIDVPPPWKPASGSKRRSRRRMVLAGTAIALLLAAIAVASVRSETGGPRYETATIVRQDVENTVTATGKIQPHAYVDVGAQVSGQLKRLHVAAGEQVGHGQLLAEIDAEVQAAKVEGIEADLARLNAELAEQEAGLAYAERQNERHLHLSRTSAVSAAAFDESRRDRDILLARIDASKARIRQMQADLRAERAALNHARIVAPMSGTVVSVDAKEGQTLNANYDTPLILRIADLDTMTVWTEVSEADVVKLHDGMPLWFTTLGRPERKWHAKLRQVLPVPPRADGKTDAAAASASGSGNVVRYTALFDVGNAGGELRAGMTAQVFFVIEAARDVLAVPVSAIDEDGTVRVLQEEGTIVSRPVETGIATRFLVEVKHGLAEGEKVVTGEMPAGPASKLRIEP
ncbi:efflux RND transporter periplasmic adaptor subunit [Aquamicrobium lusatiense]|uniref:efflux RND transporter periplasmic adaptor subunit n=1 Tax=Aquamicrobium lusatiense TaxID=89772 RepID=UPI002458C576|nr:efflux RND transporter periplasmic adaptor subunit [Aquamicrobium lusatiense]MDH4990679.1 efflux RND transporter periplasmic adaptor subunit [Aquamicrobium lusatiense]